jgi:hypothetical protein
MNKNLYNGRPLFRLTYCPNCFEFVDCLPNFQIDPKNNDDIAECPKCSYKGKMISNSDAITLKRQKKLNDLLGDSNKEKRN